MWWLGHCVVGHYVVGHSVVGHSVVGALCGGYAMVGNVPNPAQKKRGKGERAWDQGYVYLYIIITFFTKRVLQIPGK